MITQDQSVHEQTSFALYDLAPPERVRAPSEPRLIFASPKSTVSMAPAPVEPRSIMPGVLLVLGIGAALFYLSNERSFLLGQIMAGFCTPLALMGLVKGGVRKATTLAVVFGAFYGVAMLPAMVEPMLAPVVGASAMLVAYAGSAVAGLVFVIVAGMWSKRLRKRVHSTAGGVLFDRGSGAAVGLAEGVLVVLTVCWVSTLLRPQAMRLRDTANTPIDSFRHQFAGNLIRVADEASSGPLGEFIHTTNPIEKTPALKSAIDSLNATGQFSFEGLDPKLLESAQQFLNSNGAGNQTDIKDLLDKYKKSMSSRDPAYQQLPK
ncbi:MAG: CvpA family protein [Planctomycetota bacterium]